MNRYELSTQAWSEALLNEPRYRVQQVLDGMYRAFTPIEEISNLPARLRADLASTFPAALTEQRRVEAPDGTTKFLFSLADGYTIETVLIRYADRTTVCISTQAGCAMGCTFCATGQAGFDRHLNTGEIVEQVIRASQVLGARVTNVVMMGMGEPLANTGAVFQALHTLHEHCGISPRNIVVSTVGVVPGIDAIGQFDLPVTLAVSLHAARDELRNTLVPINRRYPIAALMDALSRYRARRNRRVSFEWALIRDVNHSRRDAEELASLARQARAHVNLIPLNPTSGYQNRGPEPAEVARFHGQLIDLGVNATIRRNRGSTIDAACGQLRQSSEVSLIRRTPPESPRMSG